VSDSDLELLLAECSDLDATATRLIEAANQGGGPDNITVVLARHDSGPEAETVDDLTGALYTCPLFAEMEEDLHLFLSLYLDDLHVSEGEELKLQDGLHILLQGTVESDGETFEQGTAFGFRSILNMPETGPAVRATSDCQCVVLSPNALASLQERRPALAVPVLKGVLRAIADRHKGA
jgi:hypothetical protein